VDQGHQGSGRGALQAGLSHTIREDGRFIEAGENDNLIVQKLKANTKAVGIFGYSFLEENTDKVQGSKVAGVEPTYESIADGSYAGVAPALLLSPSSPPSASCCR
jgi:ABC-type phosphate transport system substrate-binding protein